MHMGLFFWEVDLFHSASNAMRCWWIDALWPVAGDCSAGRFTSFFLDSHPYRILSTTPIPFFSPDTVVRAMDGCICERTSTHGELRLPHTSVSLQIVFRRACCVLAHLFIRLSTNANAGFLGWDRCATNTFDYLLDRAALTGIPASVKSGICLVRIRSWLVSLSMLFVRSRDTHFVSSR